MDSRFTGAIHALEVDEGPGALSVRAYDGKVIVGASTDLWGDAEIRLNLEELQVFIELLQRALAEAGAGSGGEFTSTVQALDVDAGPGSLSVRAHDGTAVVGALSDKWGGAEILLNLEQLRAFIALLQQALAEASS